jgi:flagellar basal-body rod protein FlgG
MPLSLDAAVSGMTTQQRNIDIIANNLANVNTTGYKRIKIHFQDNLDAASIASAISGATSSDEASTSAGVGVAGTARDFTQGTFQPTGSPMDFAINGDGFFRLKLDDGTTAYTRNGVFVLDGSGNVTTETGELLEPPLTMPAKFRGLTIDTDGTVKVIRDFTDAELAALGPNDPRDGKRVEAGKIALVRFSNPVGLESIGNSMFRETPDSQAPIEGPAGQDGMGTVLSGWLEASNVDIATEMTGLVMAKRGFQLNMVAYQTIEEMLKQVNQVG